MYEQLINEIMRVANSSAVAGANFGSDNQICLPCNRAFDPNVYVAIISIPWGSKSNHKCREQESV